MRGQNLIQFDNVSLGYGAKKVLENVSCSIESGDLVGLVGQNGTGKTTFLKGILATIYPQKGTIELQDGKKFAYVPQIENLNLVWPLTIHEAVCLATRSKRIFGKRMPEECIPVEEAMRKVGISGVSETLLREVSGGQRQKTVLAQALSQKPDILLLDEPTRGLDVVAERDFLELLVRLNRDEGLTILFVTHTLQIPLNYMKKILLFHENAVTATTPEELVSTKILETIYHIPFLQHEQEGMRWIMPARSGL
ncbi:MAG: ATP-binding cassette domain-containing protein [Elusimicrobia bacterium]|nr:ATP-binding cassette domain-containing protein [Candidatus Obscuribacterium magneticum]